MTLSPRLLCLAAQFMMCTGISRLGQLHVTPCNSESGAGPTYVRLCKTSGWARRSALAPSGVRVRVTGSGPPKRVCVERSEAAPGGTR
eukprot:365713-Chlamydomonas_euryale.AAC.7